MFVYDVKLLPSSPDPWGRGALALLTGYLCSLCAFEWTHCWDFSALLLRPAIAAALTLGFFASLGLHQAKREQRGAVLVTALTWAAVVCWPLKLDPILATVLFSSLLLGLLLCTLTGRRVALGLALGVPLALALLAGLWPLPIGGLLLLGATVETLRTGQQLGSQKISGMVARQRLAADANSRSVEISWKGFAALFKAAAPGEGERFTTTLLADTNSIVEACSGVRVRGSDLNGIYRFPNQAALDRCLDQLGRYHEGVVETLQSAQAPPLELIIARQE